MSTILAATNLVLRYNERTILDDATLGLDESDRIGLVGRNGCGKTTFLRILAGLQAPDSGEVTVAGHVLREGMRMRHLSGVAPQARGAHSL